MQGNDSYGFVATAKSSSLSSAMFPIQETWMVLCATCISKFLGPSFSYEVVRNLDRLSGALVGCLGKGIHLVRNLMLAIK